jgi:hypothetical protein
MTPDTIMPTAMGLHNPGATHSRRVRVVVVTTSAAAILISLPWTIFFAGTGDWIEAASSGALMAAGAIAVQMTRRNQLRGAAILLVSSLLFRLFGITLFFDVPSPGIPRSVHHFLIPLAVAAYLMLKHENAWLRHGLAWACLASVVFFASSDFRVGTGQALPDSVRGPGNWINNVSAMALLFLLLHIFVTDIDRLEARLHHARARWIKWVHAAVPDRLEHDVARIGQSIALTIPQAAAEIPVEATLSWRSTQANRVRLMVLASSALMIVFGALFATYFSLRGAMPLGALYFALVALGIVLAVLGTGKRQGSAIIVLVVGLMLILLVNAAIFDLPAPDLPRATHYWFLPLALVAHFLLRREASWIRLGLPLASLLAFVSLGSTSWGLATPYVLPLEDRPTPWMICASALGALYLLVHVLVGDIRGLEERVLSILSRW